MESGENGARDMSTAPPFPTGLAPYTRRVPNRFAALYNCLLEKFLRNRNRSWKKQQQVANK